MSHESHNPNDRLTAWGKVEQKTPPRNLEMKNVALFSLKPVEKTAHPNSRPWLRYLVPAMSVLAVLQIASVLSLSYDGSGSVSQTTSARQEKSGASATVPMAQPGDEYGANLNTELQAALGNSDLRTEVARSVAPFNGLSVIADYDANHFEEDVSDTREFLKTYYQATLRTRKVAKLATHIQTMARGYGGRVDDISVNKESAYITFVVPKDKFAMFTDELRTLVSPKFIEEIISAQNLLPEKQGIEKRTETAEQTLSSVQKQRQELINNHGVVVANFQKRINNYSAQINGLRNQFAATTSTDRQQTISNQIAYVTRQQNGVKQELTQENSRFENALRLSDANIAASEKRIGNLYEQDQDLLANVETVEASVSLQWISVWEIIELYVPIYWILSIAVVASFIGYVKYGRRQKLPLP